MCKTTHGNAFLFALLCLLLMLSYPSPELSAGQGVEPVTKSRLTDIALPRPALRITDAELLKGLSSELDKAAREHGGSFGKPEMLTWTGDEYKPADADTITQGVVEKLKSGGGKYEIGGTKNTDEGLATYFLASTAGKQILLGFWLKNEKYLLLAWGELSKADAAATSKEEKQPASKETAAPAKPATEATAATLPALPPLAPKPNVIAGRAVDRQGRPLKGVKVVVEGFTKAGARYTGTAVTDAEGKYSLLVPNSGVYKFFHAKAPVQYNERRFNLTLHPIDGKLPAFNSEKGMVKDFVLKLSGLEASDDTDPTNPFNYYGGHLRLYHADYSQAGPIPDDVKVVFTLTPQGPLADGSTGQTLTFTRTGADLKNADNQGRALEKTSTLHDIPLGRYQMTADVLLPGGRKAPLLMRLSSPAEPAKAGNAINVEFKPNSADSGHGIDLMYMVEYYTSGRAPQ